MTPPAEQKSRAVTAPRHSIHSTLLALAIGLALALMLGEIAVRCFAHFGGRPGRRLGTRDPLGIIYEPFGNSGYRQKPGKVETFINGTRATYNSMGYRGPLVSVERPAGVYRIILLGGSTTVGFGVNDGETIDSFMRGLLQTQYPGSCFEVVNLGLGGYDSYQDFERMRVDGTRLHPDLVIIHSGINDVRNAQFPELTSPPDRRTLIWEGEMQRMRQGRGVLSRAWDLTRHYSYLARIPGFMAELSNQRHTLGVIRVVEPHDAAQDYFETNVVRTVELSLASGAAVLLSRPPSAIPIRNQPSDPVERSYWIRDAGSTEEYRNRLAARMQDIARRYRAEGKPVGYVTHTLPLEQYLDDAHLTAAGNQTVARDLVAAGRPYFPSGDVSGTQRSCPGR